MCAGPRFVAHLPYSHSLDDEAHSVLNNMSRKRVRGKSSSMAHNRSDTSTLIYTTRANIYKVELIAYNKDVFHAKPSYASRPFTSHQVSFLAEQNIYMLTEALKLSTVNLAGPPVKASVPIW